MKLAIGSTPGTVATTGTMSAGSVDTPTSLTEEQEVWIPLEEEGDETESPVKSRALNFEGMMESKNDKQRKLMNGFPVKIVVVTLLTAAVAVVVNPLVLHYKSDAKSPSATPSSNVLSTPTKDSPKNEAPALSPSMETVKTSVEDKIPPTSTKTTPAVDFSLWSMLSSGLQSGEPEKPKVQFFPELADASKTVHQHLEKTVHEVDSTLHQWAHNLQEEKEKRQQQRINYQLQLQQKLKQPPN